MGAGVQVGKEFALQDADLDADPNIPYAGSYSWDHSQE